MLRKQLLVQLQKTSSQLRLESTEIPSEEDPHGEDSDEDIVELTGSDIRFLRTVFDAIGTTQHGYILDSDRDCKQLIRLLPPDHQHTIRELILVLLHRLQPARFEDFVYLICEEGRLQTLQGVFTDLLK